MEYVEAAGEPSSPACAGLECSTIPLRPEEGAMVSEASPATAIEQELPPALPLPLRRVEPLNDAAACVSETRGLELPVLAVYLMLDSSGSMEEDSGTPRTKWDAVQRAIRGFLLDVQDDERLLLGMQFFPLLKPGTSFQCEDHDDCGADGGLCFKSTCLMSETIQLCRTDADCPGGPQANPCVDFGLCAESDPDAPLACLLGAADCAMGMGACEDFQRTCTDATSCDPLSYGTPAVEIQPVSSATLAIDQALMNQLPEGLTPTVPALQGSLQHAREWALTHPDQTVVTVLATDGLPTECGVQQQSAGTEVINEVLDLARAGVSGDPPIRTFVIGVFRPGEAASINNVNAFAAAGGTGSAAFIDASGDVEDQFREALRAIVGTAAECRLSIESGPMLDFFRADLTLVGGARSGTSPAYVETAQGCATTPDGWHYDIQPELATPSAIQLCPELCDSIRPPALAGLRVQIGCSSSPE